MSQPKRYHFDRYLSRGHLYNVKGKYNFPSAETIEKFIMDYEVLFHVRNELECIVKGGMAMPFHIQDDNARRLSVDIDLATPKSLAEVRKLFNSAIQNTIGAELCAFEERLPAKRKKIELISYDVYYKSRLSDFSLPSINLDILYNFNEKMHTVAVTGENNLLAFTTDFDFTIYDQSSLIADKLTTLALRTIGIPIGHRETDIPKHIYDLGCLLRKTNTMILENCARVYEIAVNYQLRFKDHLRLTLYQVLDDTISSLDCMLNVDKQGVKITPVHSERYRDFRPHLFSPELYQDFDHKTDILLIKLLCTYLRLVTRGAMTANEYAKQFVLDLETVKNSYNWNREEIAKIRKEKIKSIGLKMDMKKLQNLDIAHLLLISRIQSIDAA